MEQKDLFTSEQVQEPVKKKRGRPKGSKNKTKIEQPSQVPSPTYSSISRPENFDPDPIVDFSVPFLILYNGDAYPQGHHKAKRSIANEILYMVEQRQRRESKVTQWKDHGVKNLGET